MNIDLNYDCWINYCKIIQKQIIESLDKNEIINLQQHLINIGLNGYKNWVKNNNKDIEAFISSQPSIHTKGEWLEDKFHYLKVCLAGIQYSYSAQCFLISLDYNKVLSQVFLPDVLLASKNSFFQIHSFDSFQYWPFPECYNPFD